MATINNRDKNLLILGLAKKAGLLAIGAEDTSSAARAGKARLIISACDASGNALRRASNSAEVGRAPYIIAPFTSFELGIASGRGSPGTLAILDVGLAAAFMKGLAASEPDRYSDVAEILSQKASVRSAKTQRPPSGKRRTAI